MFKRFDISILVNGLPCDGETLQTRGLGGSESAGLYMAKALAHEGARVNVFCNTENASRDAQGVNYLPARTWSTFAKVTPHDVCVAQRAAEVFAQRTNARLNLLWCHDLALGRLDQSFRGALWNVDRVIVLSNYMRQQYHEVHQLEDDAFFVTRNGVDLELFRELAAQGIARDRKKLIYAARPERGLDVLLSHIMPKLLEKDGDFRLYIAGYDHRPPEWAGFYSECERLAVALGDRVISLGCLPKRELYAHYLSAGVYVYPTPSPVLANFREVSCIGAMECQAAGLPIVTTSMGALPETIAADAGISIEGDPSNPASLKSYVEEFVGRVVTLCNDDEAWNRASEAGLVRARELDWSGVAREWLVEFERLIRAGNDRPERLVRHFWRTADIVAAKHLLGRDALEPTWNDDAARLLLPWSFMEEPGGYRTQYERIGARRAGKNYEPPTQDQRFRLLAQWLSDRKGELVNLLDYGCGDGTFAIGLVQRLPHLRVQGVDIDPFSVNTAIRWATELSVSDRATFSVVNGDTVGSLAATRSSEAAPFDCATIQEVLEHVPEPWTVLQDAERQVRRGGKVYITVPFGPWELTSYRLSTTRCHVWHFDEHDLRDMLGSKPDFVIDAMYACDSPITGDALGWWVLSYTVDHEPVPAIDLDRHLWLQRPRQTISATLIAGPNSEETLHWTLRSLQDVADEVILADCGMGEEARRIASQYNMRIIPGVDPKQEGFERARNVALEASRCDWCLWIDTDEKLVGAETLSKYLRENVYHAYGLRQHHFACDTKFSPDMPVRLFRRRPYKGRSLQFWGAIHEHPELAVNEGPGPAIVLRDVHIAHVGYLIESTRRARFVRNWPLLKLDQERYPDRLLQKYFVMRENMHLVRFALEDNGGQVDEEMRQRCRETIELYRTHFLGKPHGTIPDALSFYSQALEVLGEGFEAAFQVEADKERAVTNGVQRYRFASAEDFYAELERNARAKAARFDSQWW